MASVAQVSHFLQPGLANTYADAFPSTSWIICEEKAQERTPILSIQKEEVHKKKKF